MSDKISIAALREEATSTRRPNPAMAALPTGNLLALIEAVEAARELQEQMDSAVGLRLNQALARFDFGEEQ